MKQSLLALTRYKALNKWRIKNEANTLYVTKCLLNKKSWQKYTSIEWKHQEKCYFYGDLLEKSLKKNNSFA